ncbi:MAG: hypothetical protein QNJ72_18390, partial [Pleurocapsa sp. MO_226.B13]|nr:hypothetical protein [Pleurocapsa sp. MO_226.B13]
MRNGIICKYSSLKFWGIRHQDFDRYLKHLTYNKRSSALDCGGITQDSFNQGRDASLRLPQAVRRPTAFRSL